MPRLLLLGAGHAHAQVLLDLIQRPIPGLTITLVSPQAQAPYSGMIPGWLTGRHRWEDLCIDFQSLCQRAGAEFIAAELRALDPDRAQATLSTGQVLGYALLSLNLGSTLIPPPELADHQTLLSLRPLSQLQPAWQAVLAQLQSGPLSARGRPTIARGSPTHKLTLTTVGAGAAGLEALLAIRQRLLADHPSLQVAAELVSRSRELLPAMPWMARWLAARVLARQQVRLSLGQAYRPERERQAQLPAQTQTTPQALLVWATGAQAQDWQRDPARRGSLAVNEHGFVRVGRDLISLSHRNILAVGDCASLPQPIPKAGVFAVRMGPVLVQAIRHALLGLEPPTLVTKPPVYRHFPLALMLLQVSDRHAIAAWGPFALKSRWALRWKDQIDLAFVRRFQATRHPTDALGPN